MKRRSTMVLIFLLIAGTAMAGSGKNRQERPMENMPCMRMHAGTAQLDVDEQKKLNQAKLEFEKSALPLRAEIRVLNMEINQMIASGKTGKDLDAALDKLNTLRARLNKEQVAHRVAVRSAIGEEKYLQMGYSYGAAGRMDGSRMKTDHCYYRSQRANCYYPNTKSDGCCDRYHRR